MPSTNLPGDSLKGTAGFRYFPGGSTSVAEAVHTLNWPAELVPGGGASYRTNKFRSPVQSLDLEHREVWTIGSGREEATLRLRFDDWPDSLMDMLEDAADGVTLDYYPRLASTNLSFPVHVLDAEGRISEDSDRFAQAEYEADLMLRDASTDRQGFWWLKNDNKLKNPRLVRGTTDGVAEGWESAGSTGATVFIASGVRSQRINIFGSTSGADTRVRQQVFGVLEGDTVELSVDTGYQGSTDAKTQLQIIFRDSTGGNLGSEETDVTTSRFVRRSVSRVAPANTVQVSVLLWQRVLTAGSSGTSDFRDAKLTLS